MKIKLFTLVLASTLLAHCGSEHDTDGGSWDDAPKNKEESTDPAKPATAGPADLDKPKDDEKAADKSGADAPPTSAQAPSGSTDLTSVPPVVEKPKSPAHGKKVRRLDGESIEPSWEISDASKTWHAQVETINIYAALVSIDENYTTVLKSVRLGLTHNANSNPRLTTFVSDPIRKSWYSTTVETVTLKRDSETGHCEVTYFSDGFWDKTMIMRSDSCQ